VVLNLSLDASQRMRAAVAALQQLPKQVKDDVATATRERVVPMAVSAAERTADSPVTARIAHTGRYAPLRGVPGVAFGGAAPVTSGRGGQKPAKGRELVRGLEFGARGVKQRTITTTSSKGKQYRVRKRTTRQFGPDRSEHPRFIYPAMDSIADDVVELWLDVLEAAVIDALGRD
jgi:hypothetical protein